MYIKRINNVVGYKDLPDGFSADFSENKTYIIGANFQRKTTVGSLFNWCLTGTSLLGNEKPQVTHDKRSNSNVIVDITFVDNFGIEHRLVRNKGKSTTLILDDKEIEQGMLGQYYKDKDVFLVAHNPYYFNTMDPKDQRDVIRKVVPAVNPNIIFNYLTEDEKKVIGGPIEFLNTYTDDKNKELNELKEEYSKNCGQLQVYKNIALCQEGELLTFDKEEELKKLQERYEEITMDFGNSNLEDLERSIKRIDSDLKKIFEVDLKQITENYSKENAKLKEFENEKPICPSCRQEIKDSDTRNHLIRFQQKQLEKLQEKADKLKQEAKELIDKKNNKSELYKKLNTADAEDLTKEKNELREKIEFLQKEKNNILLHNKEVQTKQQQVKDAKNKIILIEKTQEEIKFSIEKNKLQKQIAIKMKRLTIEKQQEIVNKYLNKVTIIFSRINKTNDNITECCDIQYEGRDYKKLSKSQQVRASLEISNLFNNLSGIKAPIFLDDAESTTDIEEMSKNQMIISLVIKYNPLEILFDYEDVLDRKQKSVEKEKIEQKGFFMQNAA